MTAFTDDENEGRSAGAKPYEVGYGRPPKDTQFKKGVSGNPSGKPKRKTTPPKSSAELRLELANELVPATIDGKRKLIRSERRWSVFPSKRPRRIRGRESSCSTSLTPMRPTGAASASAWRRSRGLTGLKSRNSSFGTLRGRP